MILTLEKLSEQGIQSSYFRGRSGRTLQGTPVPLYTRTFPWLGVCPPVL